MKSCTKNNRNLPAALAWTLVALCGTSGCVMDDRDSDEEVAAEAAAISTIPGAHTHWRVTSSYKDRSQLISHLDSLDASNTNIDAMATTPEGEWIVVANNTTTRSSGFPFATAFYAAALMSAGQTVRAIDFNADGGWVVVGDTTYFTGGPVPASAINQIEWYLYTKGWAIRDVDITTSGYVILGPGTAVSYSGVGADLNRVLYDRHASKRTVHHVEIGFDGRWAVISDQEPATKGVSSTLATVLRNAAKNKRSVSRLMLGVGDNFVAYSHGTVAHDTSNPMEVIEYELSTATGLKNIWQRMEEAGIPGVSIALVDGNQIAYARSYGVLEAGKQTPVLSTTPFDLASLSKYLGALVVLRLQELGWITSLDQNILNNPGSIVASWEQTGSNSMASSFYFGAPGAALPAGMTLRRLMSHRAAIRAEGGSPRAPSEHWANLAAPTTVWWLLGYECSISNQPCGFFQNKYVWTDPNLTVGGSPVYASGNFLLAQAVAEDATWGTPGADLLDYFLFGPLGMSDASGQAPLPASLESRAAWQHDSNGPRFSRTVYPWTFAGGVYASALDYARALILALNQGRDAGGVQRIGSAQIAELLSGDFGRGLGVRLENGNNAGEGTNRAFFHSGGHGGRARTWMCGNPTRDEGIVILINADTAGVSAFINEVLDAFTSAMGWPSTLNCR